MQCPFCSASTVVVNLREDENGSIRRRRQCHDCRRGFTTVETCLLIALSRAAVTEPFSRQSVMTGVRTAAQRSLRVVDAHARSRRSKKSSLAPYICRHPVRQETDTSRNGAWSPFSLVPALGRG
ncbi:hypothetical protein ACFYRD_08055 [Streptomyces hirsutus]|uniref:NrdR family transcriptional regulator n=1 Tax=Streptomyces hirsutus TaxID=35620 RepID=UPI0036B2E4EA